MAWWRDGPGHPGGGLRRPPMAGLPDVGARPTAAQTLDCISAAFGDIRPQGGQARPSKRPPDIHQLQNAASSPSGLFASRRLLFEAGRASRGHGGWASGGMSRSGGNAIRCLRGVAAHQIHPKSKALGVSIPAEAHPPSPGDAPDPRGYQSSNRARRRRCRRQCRRSGRGLRSREAQPIRPGLQLPARSVLPAPAPRTRILRARAPSSRGTFRLARRCPRSRHGVRRWLFRRRVRL